MRNLKEIPRRTGATDLASMPQTWAIEGLTKDLETNGVVVLPPLVSAAQLRSMQAAFAARLSHLRWNNFDGYQQTEPYRHMVEDVLLLDQGFVDLAVHPLVKAILDRYLGNSYALTEAKGWKSLPTKRDFHGWHADAWYDQTTEKEIHKEIKLAMYLTDVESGAFNFIKGSHRKQHPHSLRKDELSSLALADLIELKGKAGTVFLFDTSAIHRQGIPMLEPREAVFYAYHDPNVPLQKEDVDYYRYHPLLLNAAFLGNLTPEDERILGFGNKTNYQPAFARKERPSIVHRAYSASLGVGLRLKQLRERGAARLKRIK